MQEAVQLNPDLTAQFPDLHPPLDSQAAVVEANRCLNCFDAPCTAACPTHIDVPRFIKKIATGNLKGSALAILDANILGASCSRVCPVGVLCEGACVMHRYNKQPIEIGRLQRYAMDNFYRSEAQLQKRSVSDRKQKVACIGGGPASLSCAAELRQRGYQVTVFERRTAAGGLNAFGVAEYKLRFAESLKEVEMIKGLGVEFQLGVSITGKSDLIRLEDEFDAIFVGVGLGNMRTLGIPGEVNAAVIDAVNFIESYKSGKRAAIKGRVLVVGAGNTGIDAAIASIRLGAVEVTILSRRTEKQMSAFPFEYDHAKQEGVQFRWLMQPVAIKRAADGSNVLECMKTKLTAYDKATTIAGTNFSLAFDTLISAIGQTPLLELLHHFSNVELNHGRVVIDQETGRTSNPKIYAGGDCVNGGREVVDAVADGKRAAVAISKALEVSG
jgi:dihydropyrimidine dehydrogenase (NAD+) subunit PreT